LNYLPINVRTPSHSLISGSGSAGICTKNRGRLPAIPRIPPIISLSSAFPAGEIYFFVIPVIIVAQKHATVSHANTL